MNQQRLQRIEELKARYEGKALDPRYIELIFNEGYILGYNTALLPREESKDESNS